MKNRRDPVVITSLSSTIDWCATFKKESGNWGIDWAAWGHPRFWFCNWLASPPPRWTQKQASWEDAYWMFMVNQLGFDVSITNVDHQIHFKCRCLKGELLIKVCVLKKF